MKMKLIHSVLATGILMFPALAFGRVVEIWEYERLFKESDLVVIAVPQRTELANDGPPEHSWPLEFVGQNSTFKVKHTFKGRATAEQIKVLHFRFGDKLRKGVKSITEPLQIVDGPLFVEFRIKPATEYLLFLKSLKDGRYEPVSGRIDPALSVRKFSSSPENARKLEAAQTPKMPRAEDAESAPPTTKGARDELEKIKGKWDVGHFESAGESTDRQVLANQTATITDDRITFTNASGMRIAAFPFRIDPSKNPKAISIHISHYYFKYDKNPDLDDLVKKVITYPGIYSLEGNTLKICFTIGEPKEDAALTAPKAYKSTAEPPTVLIVLQRKESTPKAEQTPKMPRADDDTADDEQEKAVKVFEAMKARVTRDEKAAGRPVVGLSLFRTGANDDALKNLKALKHLRELDLLGTGITDAGLKELRRLHKLQDLNLRFTNVTGAGLRELKNLKNLQTLSLPDRLTDGRTDEMLKALREVNLLHALSSAAARGGKRPTGPLDVETMSLPSLIRTSRMPGSKNSRDLRTFSTCT
jgi:uncharacterized protein (TIGR03067 family)